MTRQKISPATLLRKESRALRRLASGVASGDVDSVHRARVAIRRLRELLPLCKDVEPDTDKLRAKLASLTDALGRVRDLDVGLSVIAHLSRRSPRIADSLEPFQRAEERRRHHELRVLHRRTADFRRIAARRRSGPVRAAYDRRHWSERLARRLDRRRKEAVAAINRATTPEQFKALHEARIAIKKLRYATEAAVRLGMLRNALALRRFKRAQDLLGEIRDRQLLVAHLQARIGGPPEGTEASRAIVRLIDADVARLFRRYLQMRAALLASVRRVRTLTPAA